MALIDEIYAQKGSVRILELGGRRNYMDMLGEAYLRDRKVEVTLLNHLASQLPPQSHPGFVLKTGDACALTDIPDNAYDLVPSNSTIEHVGNWDRVEAFAAESRRVAPRHYVQTPYFWFPIEPHFLMPGFQFLPEGVRANMFVNNWVRHKARNPTFTWAMNAIQGARLLERTRMRFLFPAAKLKFEWFGPLPKSMPLSDKHRFK